MAQRKSHAGMVAKMMAGTDAEARRFQQTVAETVRVTGSTEQEVLAALVAGMDGFVQSGAGKITARRTDTARRKRR